VPPRDRDSTNLVEGSAVEVCAKKRAGQLARAGEPGIVAGRSNQATGGQRKRWRCVDALELADYDPHIAQDSTGAIAEPASSATIL
jgi:hypothetical protein